MLCVDGRLLETLRIPARRRGVPAIVLLHDGLGSVAAWRTFPQRLGERTGCEVFAYSRYGHGRSSRLGERRDIAYMHREAEVVLPELLERVGIERPVLFGHSDGASIALIAAGARDDLARALIAEAPHVFVEGHGLAGIARARDAFEHADLALRLARYHDDAATTFRGWNEIWLDRAFVSWNIEAYVDRITCPVLAVQGSDDEYGTAAQLAAIEARVPWARSVLLSHCGHTPHRDQPERVLELVTAFVESLG